MSFVYFIREEERGHVKIGIATNPLTRLATLQTGNPDHLSIEGLGYGTAVAEFALHVRFHEFRIRGEWFRPGQPILDFIDTLPTIDEVEAGEPVPDLDAEFHLDAIGMKMSGITRPRMKRRSSSA